MPRSTRVRLAGGLLAALVVVVPTSLGGLAAADSADPAAPQAVDESVPYSAGLPPQVEEVTSNLYVVDANADEAFATDAIDVGDVVRTDNAGVTVPPPGTGVGNAGVVAEGVETELVVETATDGTVVVYPSGDGTGASEPDPLNPTGGGAKCNDDAYNAANHTWNGSFNWRFKSSSTPSGMDADTAKDTLIEATKNIINVRNDCGLGNNTQATQSYGGSTTTGPNIQTSNDCGNADGLNVTAFKAQDPAGRLATTCWWWNGNGVTIESDAAIDTDHTFYNSVPSNCSNEWSLEALMTHERGHTYGLGHVGEPQHGYLTMSPNMDACQNSESTLGLGDWEGMRAAY